MQRIQCKIYPTWQYRKFAVNSKRMAKFFLFYSYNGFAIKPMHQE
jgi:hypothetical protein